MNDKTKKIESDYSKYIAMSRYARYQDGLDRRETWEETVTRLCDFWQKRYPDVFPYETIKNGVLNMEEMPSMRSLMTAGKALERDQVSGYNPVSGDTRIVTKEYGNIAIKNLENKSATVLNIDGRWTPATFRSYGKQKLFNVKLKLNSNTEKTVQCTENHRWVLNDRSVLSTKSLKKGDKIPFSFAPKPQIDKDYDLGIKHGIVYGDGTATKICERVKGYHVRLCGDSRELLRYFPDYPICYPPSANGDPVVMMYDGFAATHSLKELPPNDETESYLLGFIRGWLAADGSITKTSQVSLCTSDPGLEWLKNNCEKLGFVVQRICKQPSETNYGKRRQGSYVVYISRSSCVADDFLCSWKRKHFEELESHFSVSDVEETELFEEVFCAEVPDTNTFVIEGGLVTGNCSYLPINDPRCFDEAMYVLMCGTGVGFSVERQEVSKLPQIPDELFESDTVIKVKDSKIGWCTGLRELVSLLYAGKVPKWDLSGLRPAGARLKVFGGRSSGPAPLNDVYTFIVSVFKRAVGRKLTSIECHDIVCKIAECVVVGGVRRSALISLSNLSDERMRDAKTGQWWETNAQRALANNSAVYTEKPEIGIFMKEWLSLYNSKSGERGIVNRQAAKKKAVETGRRDPNFDFGTNPCSEIVLRPFGFCNLSEVVIRENDTLESLRKKVEISTILGTFQSTLTDFRYLRNIWKKNAEEERLLGVSLTGVMDHPVMSGKQGKEVLEQWLSELKDCAIATNKEWAEKLGISQSVSITCVKPSGTVSQLVNSSSGIHPRYSKHYVRTVRADKNDPLALFLMVQGVPCEDDVTKPNSTYVFSFPMKSPDSAITAPELSAIQQLELYLSYQRKWTEHNISITVYVREHEWMEVGAWVYKHFDEVGGVSFLPYSDHVYRQAPYQPISKEECEKLAADFPDINWEQFTESGDSTKGAQEYACVSGMCELI
jgi:ribonucleoside-diphosphate reductase alpha chain